MLYLSANTRLLPNDILYIQQHTLWHVPCKILGMSKERWNVITIDGVALIYDYRVSWDRLYYSFDGRRWHAKKRTAYEQAKADGTLRAYVPQNRASAQPAQE